MFLKPYNCSAYEMLSVQNLDKSIDKNPGLQEDF